MQDTYRSLILSALYEKNVKSIENINSILIETFGIKPLPTNFLEKYLVELRSEKKVVVKNNEYCLSEEMRKELKSGLEKRLELRKLINRSIIDQVKTRYSVKEPNKLINIFNDILLTFFTTSARLFSGYLTEEQRLVFDIPNLETILNEKSLVIPDVKLREALKESIKEEITKENSFFYTFLYEIFQIYVCFEILSVDPECKIELNINEVFLDTNVLLDLLIPSRKRHLLAMDYVKLSQELDIENKYTRQTSNELLEVIQEYKKASSFSNNVLKSLARSDWGGLIEAFFIEKVNNPSLSFDGYCLGLEKSFKRMLKEEFNVEYDDKRYRSVRKRAKSLEPLIKKLGLLMFLKYKSNSAINHDAFSLELQRNKNSFFITNDKSLFVVSKYLIDREEISKPLSIETNVWLTALTFIKPLKTEGSSFEAFKDFLVSPLASTLRPISMNKLISVAFPWIKEKYLTANDLGDIITRKFIEDHIIKPQEEEGIPILTANQIIPQMIDEKIKEKMNALQKENVERKRKQQIAEKNYQKIVSSPIKIKPLFYMGIISIMTICIFAFLSAIFNLSIPDIIYQCFTFLGIIFVGGSIFGEKIFTKLGEKIR